MDGSQHECDLFLLSSHHAYMASRALPEFVRLGHENLHGWGIGSYVDGRANVLRSAEPAVERDECLQISREFGTAVRDVSSQVILGHLRRASRGSVRPENNHPFKLDFLGYDWLLVHNGTARGHERLVPMEDRIIDSDSDSARVLEFLRSRVLAYLRGRPVRSLIEGSRHGFADLLEARPDSKFNLIVSNGYISFALIHWRPFHLLYREKPPGGVALLSTLRLTQGEDWIDIRRRSGKLAKMLVFSGPNLVLNGDISR